ncbi:hypothetical protein [Metabacillus bambusae]|uniref:Uncharacterized protein n=1 Tax=Metabacillus bambusae TaxID=2795218 RepID=A0ABS3N0I0_9BACI|nr:hypothetical protein [Metabacillus bambusae]MBO1511777.1 hypothetical protein [Metabacillus bambusae]
MRHISIYIIVFVSILIPILPTNTLGENKKPLSDEELWDSTVREYLKEDLWIGKEGYIAANSLMVPMHIAFQENKKEWIDDFQHHFLKLSSSGLNNSIDASERLNTLQYYYLVSRFIYLCEFYHYPFPEAEKLTNHMIKVIEKIWTTSPAWMWNKVDFKGAKERVSWKLKNKNVDKSYYRAITDEELFIFSISADLKSIYYLKGLKNNTIDSIVDTAYTVYFQESKFTNNGNWIFQPGVYKEHPDYKFAGTDLVLNEEFPFYIENIAKDTSHSHRFPLWILSLRNSFPKNSKEFLFFNKVFNGLENQFYEEVLVPSDENHFDIPLTTNYMDGTNGIYRYNYSSLKRGDGYYPFELSGTLTLGWWSFLGSNRILATYKELASKFPLESQQLDVMLKKRSTLQNHNNVSIASGEKAFINGFRELICRLAINNKTSKQ